MKKTYINPTMKVVMLKQRSNLLTTSVTMYGKNAEGAAMARGFDDDFDDFDD